MSNWQSYLKKDTLEWLLEDNNPSIKYFTLVDLLEKSPNTSDVYTAKAKIMTEGEVPKILKKQKPKGYWEDPLSFYLPKRKATLWQFYHLVELAADGNDERIRKTCEYLLGNSQHKESGGFSGHSYEYLRHIANGNPRPSERVLLKNFGDFSDDLKGGSSVIVPCLTGQLLYCFIRYGYTNDSRVQKCIDWITEYMRFDDGETKPPKEWPYKLPILHYGESCWGKHTCHTGVVNVLLALSEIPKKKRSKDVKNVIDQAAEHMLKHHIYKRSHDLDQISIPDIIKLGHPHLDFLRVLLILLRLGYKEERMEDAIDLLKNKQNANGRWIAEINGYDKKGQESKWITLNALKCLKIWHR